MKIYLPHLNYTIFVKPFKKAPDVMPNALTYCERINNKSCNIYVSKKNIPGDLAHELVHVLQFICIDRNIDFTSETEHMGYLMHYLMGQIMGYEWI